MKLKPLARNVRVTGHAMLLTQVTVFYTVNLGEFYALLFERDGCFIVMRG